MTPTNKPSPESVEKAAQLWCLPQHAKKEMDADFALSIAAALDEAERRGENRAIGSSAACVVALRGVKHPEAIPALLDAVKLFESEHTNPAKDYALLRRRREELFSAFAALGWEAPK